MRLTRLQGGELRRDGVALNDAIKAVGFFPGRGWSLWKTPMKIAPKQFWQGFAIGRPVMRRWLSSVVPLKPTSKIRKAFEAHPNAWSIAIFDEPPTRAEVEAALAKVGMGEVDAAASAAITDLSKAIDPGDFSQFLEKLALYCMSQAGPVTLSDVEVCAPQSTEAALDDVIGLVADSKNK